MSNASPRTAVSVVLCTFFALAASAQDVVNPTKVEFQPSVDHFVVTASGDPVILRYDLQFYASGAPESMATVSLGKPSPEADGMIRVDFSTLLATWPLADGTYTAKVAAVGGSGNGSSAPSNTFSFISATTPPVVTCSFALSSTRLSVGRTGGTSSLSVTASGTTCAWTSSNPASWISLTPAAATGSGTATITVAPNTTTSSRTASFTVAGQAVTITQAASRSKPPKGVQGVVVIVG